MEWTDPHAGNIGIMPDENMAVLDGAIYARDASDPLPARASISPEDAVRLLRQYGFTAPVAAGAAQGGE
jgi:hypothetical protein